MRLPVLLLLLGICSFATAQRIENVQAHAEGSRVTITFDIVDATPGQTFNVKIYSSYNQFSAPLQNLEGSFGEAVHGGKGNQVVWDARPELGASYDDNLLFEVRAIPSAIPWSFKSPAGGKTLRLGKSVDISWTGGSPEQQVQIDLMRGTNVVRENIGRTSNNGYYSWKIDDSLEKGDGYQFKVSTEGGNQSITSPQFSIKGKPPVWLYIAPLAVAGGAAALLSGGGGNDSGGGGGGGANDLPNPPDVPLN